MTCVVHDHIDMPMNAHHAIDGSVDGALRDDIHFDGAKIGLVVGRKGLDRLNLSGIAACGCTHSGEDRMTRSRETLRGYESEAARGAGDDDDFVHVGFPVRGFDQTMPPLTRSVWPSTQPASGPTRNATTLAMSSGWARRSIGGSFARCSICSGVLSFKKRWVAVGPGAMALTAMSRPRNSLAKMLVRVSTAALVAAYTE